MPIELPVVLIEQEEAWRAVFEIYSNRPHGWIMVGGQSVYLHAIERGAPFIRPTKDADIALNIRAYPTMLHDFTALLLRLNFEPRGESLEGHQHRWVRGTNLLGCLIGKAAALKIVDDPGKERHVTDFLTLAAVVGASDLRDIVYGPAERSHLAHMLGHLAVSPELVSLVPEGAPGLERLRMSLS